MRSRRDEALDHEEAKVLVLLDVDRSLPRSFSIHETADRLVDRGLLRASGRSWAFTPAGRAALAEAHRKLGTTPRATRDPGELPGPKPKKYRRPAKPRTARFRPEQRVSARWGTRSPSGAWVSRGARGTVEGISDSRDRFVVRWDDHPRETGWYDADVLEA